MFIGDIMFILPVIIMPTIVGLIISLILYVIRIIRRSEQRADERLRIDKENTAFQKQQMEEVRQLNQRLTDIEDLLKQVE